MRSLLTGAAWRKILPAICLLLAVSAQANSLTMLKQTLIANMSDLPRYTKLPLFDPHRKTFSCTYQVDHVPPLDPQAEAWFQQGLALESPDIWPDDRDYAQIYRLYRSAAERNHWKAMLNLASLILEGHQGLPEQGNEAAIRWMEKAMELGVPDAWDRMGVYHQNGIVKGGNATSAYAFFQKAADMGSPAAMAYIGYKLAGTYDNPGAGFWGNLSVGTAMLECAFAQGYGDAAEKLGFIYARPETPEARLRALNVLHEGVKLGSAVCASALASEFHGFNLTNGRNLPGRVDKDRSDRYGVLRDALEFYGDRLKLPNLDKILPLPPASLPKWDGNKKTLIDAAKAVTPPATKGREFIPEGHAVRPLHESLGSIRGDKMPPQSHEFFAHLTAAGWLRRLVASAPSMTCAGSQRCPETGIWEGRIENDHPLASLYNRWDQQAFVERGQSFPDPQARYLDVAPESVRWTYLGSVNADGDAPGIKRIAL